MIKPNGIIDANDKCILRVTLELYESDAATVEFKACNSETYKVSDAKRLLKLANYRLGMSTEEMDELVQKGEMIAGVPE